MSELSSYQSASRDTQPAGPPSILRVASHLESALETAPVFEGWCQRIADVLEECRGSVLRDLRNLEGDGGTGGGMMAEIGWKEPRLISRLDQLDLELHKLLGELDDAIRTSVESRTSIVRKCTELVDELRHVVEGEVAIVYESLRPIGGGD